MQKLKSEVRCRKSDFRHPISDIQNRGDFLKIKNIKINSYGKIKNKEINLGDNINIIYGKNESGKSTLLKFISNMFYGSSKNKNKKEISDFDKYKPWIGEEFSGKLIYQLDNNEQYEVYREFSKKNPKIYDENGQDISKQFNIDKNKGSEFFKEQTGINEDLFYSTAVVQQDETQLDQQQQNNIIQKISNLISTGNDDISYKKTIEKLNKKLLDEVGTNKTTERPINIINEKLNNLYLRIEKIKEIKNKKYEIEEIKKQYENEIKNTENNLKIIKQIKNNKEKENIDNEIINLNIKMENEINEQINEINKKIENKKTEKNKLNINYFILPILIIINILLFIFNKIKYINYFFVLISFIYLIFIVLKLIKNNNKKNSEKNELENKLKLLQENKKNKIIEIEKLKNNLEEKINNNKNNLNQEFEKEIIERYINLENDTINNLFDEEEIKYRNISLKLQQINLEKNIIMPELNEEANITEQITNLEEQKENLISLGNSIQIAKNTLEEAYEILKNSISPEFTKSLSEIAKEISNNKYQNVKLNDNDGLLIEGEDGRYIGANLLSYGTIDQMYLALRLSGLKQLSNETIPIILDETFAYYDNERLKNILEYLAKQFKNYQIIILTCSNREKDALEELKFEYNYVEL